MPGFAGLQTNLWTWMIVAGLTACWVMSVKLVPGWARDGWPALLKSLYGLVWLGFGLDIVLRFLMLSYNAVEWGNGTLRLLALPTDTLNKTLSYCLLFWILLVVGYGLAVRRKAAGPLGLTESLSLDFVYAAAIPVSVAACVTFYFVDGRTNFPLVLITPLALLANLYMVAATIAWWHHFRQPGPWWRIGSIHWIVLLPALVRGVVSPYRENLAPLILIPLTAALFAGRRLALAKIVTVGLACLLILSSAVSSYRRIKWDNVRPEEVLRELTDGGISGWLTGASNEPTHRFHAFDSMLLTVALVPAMQPYSGRNVLVSPFLRGFLPRFVYANKSAADAGVSFGSRIWAFDDPTVRENSWASIAPSMPGDLFEAGGVLYIALGALLWGALLGLVDGWKAHLPVFCAAAITSLLATQCAMSVERDFDNSLATFIQTLLVLVVVAGVVALARRRSSDFPFGVHPGLERS